jgi:hypothetical protein
LADDERSCIVPDHVVVSVTPLREARVPSTSSRALSLAGVACPCRYFISALHNTRRTPTKIRQRQGMTFGPRFS